VYATRPTLTILLFRSAKNIKNKPEALARVAKRTLIKEYSGEIEALRSRLATQIAANGYWMSMEEKEAAEAELAGLRAGVEELEALKLASEEEIAGLKQELADTRVRSCC
jgi:kinesin family protein 11